MDHEDYCSSSRFSPEPGPWSCQYPERDPSLPAMDSPHRESPRFLHSTRRHASVPISRQSSGYSSNVSGCSSSRNNRGLILPGGRRSLSHMRDSLVSVDEGSVINNYFFFNTAPTQCPEERNDTERLNHSSQIVRSISEPTVFGRRRRGDIPTCHISPRNERLLNEFAPLLVDDMDANALLPHLMRYGLANREDTDYISNPLRTGWDRNMHIIRTAPHKDSNAFERFVKCLEEVQSDLAVQLRQRMRRPSSARLQLADEVTTYQQGHAYEEPNESESVMVPQPTRDTGPDSQDLSPPTRLPKVFHEKRSHDRYEERSHDRHEERSYDHHEERSHDHQDDRSPDSQDERSPDSQEVQADLSRGDSSHYTCKKLMQRKLTWLQESTAFQDCHEEIQFCSRTNCGEHRKVLHYGTLYQQGKTRFVVLLTDFLLVLKLLEPHRHSRRAAEQQRFEDHMFSNNKYITGKPLLLHHLEVQGQNKQQDSFSLHYKQTSVDLCFEAPSRTSRDAWLEALADAIENSCRLQSRLKLHIGSEVAGSLSGRGQWLSLTILGASALLSVRECSGYCRRLFCTVMLGQHQQCRTPCVEGKTDASWNFTFEFWKFATTDTLEIGVWQENNFCPDDLLGVVRIPILVMTDKHTNTIHPGHEMEASLPLKPSGRGEMHLKIYTDINC